MVVVPPERTSRWRGQRTGEPEHAQECDTAQDAAGNLDLQRTCLLLQPPVLVQINLPTVVCAGAQPIALTLAQQQNYHTSAWVLGLLGRYCATGSFGWSHIQLG